MPQVSSHKRRGPADSLFAQPRAGAIDSMAEKYGKVPFQEIGTL